MSDKQWDAAWAALVLAFLMLLYGITGEGDCQDQVKIEHAKAQLFKTNLETKQ